jgi:transcriptional regulator with XRE-family HTH domain
LTLGSVNSLFTNTMTFGEWLRKKLKDRDMSNARLARLSNLSPTYIGNLVRDFSPNSRSGKIRPSEEAVAGIVKALGADLNEARLAAGYAPVADSSTSIPITDDIRVVLERRELTPDEAEEFERAVATAVAIAEERIKSKTEK